MSDLLRQYEPHELMLTGYPWEWDHESQAADQSNRHPGDGPRLNLPIKDLIREQADHRCVRCGHPYMSGEHGSGEWSPCDDLCEHGGPFQLRVPGDFAWSFYDGGADVQVLRGGEAPFEVEAQWRILTVHHLDGDKANCRWWNLAALCQRCHLAIQGRVKMQQLYIHEHSDWFKIYAAGYYAHTYLRQDLTREETLARLDELLDLELDPSYHR